LLGELPIVVGVEERQFASFDGLTACAGDSLAGIGADIALPKFANVFDKKVDETGAAGGIGEKRKLVGLKCSADSPAEKFALSDPRDKPHAAIRCEHDLFGEGVEGGNARGEKRIALVRESFANRDGGPSRGSDPKGAPNRGRGAKGGPVAE
jgi:hypothetical protein